MLGRFVLLTLAIAAGIAVAMPGARLGRPAAPTTPPAARPKSPDAAAGSVTLKRDPDGHFYAEGAVNGQPVRFLVDTGATTVVLTRADAQRIGVDFRRDRFAVVGEGASGAVRGAPIDLASVSVGAKTLNDVSGYVVDDGLDVSLLGQSFLARIATVRIAGDALTLD